MPTSGARPPAWVEADDAAAPVDEAGCDPTSDRRTVVGDAGPVAAAADVLGDEDELVAEGAAADAAGTEDAGRAGELDDREPVDPGAEPEGAAEADAAVPAGAGATAAADAPGAVAAEDGGVAAGRDGVPEAEAAASEPEVADPEGAGPEVAELELADPEVAGTGRAGADADREIADEAAAAAEAADAAAESAATAATAADVGATERRTRRVGSFSVPFGRNSGRASVRRIALASGRWAEACIGPSADAPSGPANIDMLGVDAPAAAAAPAAPVVASEEPPPSDEVADGLGEADEAGDPAATDGTDEPAATDEAGEPAGTDDEADEPGTAGEPGVLEEPAGSPGGVVAEGSPLDAADEDTVPVGAADDRAMTGPDGLLVVTDGGVAARWADETGAAAPLGTVGVGAAPAGGVAVEAEGVPCVGFGAGTETVAGADTARAGAAEVSTGDRRIGATVEADGAMFVGKPELEAPTTEVEPVVPDARTAEAAGRAAAGADVREGAGAAAARRASAVAVARARRRRSRLDGAGALRGPAPGRGEEGGTGREESVAAEGVRSPVTADDARPDPPSFPGRAGGSAVRAATCERITRESEFIVIFPLARTSSATRTGIVWGARRCVEPPGRYEDWSGTRSSIRGRPRRASGAGTGSWVERTADTSDHQRGGATFAGPVPTEMEAAGPTRERRTATERPQPSEKRTDDDATEPMRAGRRWPSVGPGRRMRTPIERPRRVRGSSSDGGVRLTGSSPGTRCARPRGSRTGRRPGRRSASDRSTRRRTRPRTPRSAGAHRCCPGRSPRRWSA